MKGMIEKKTIINVAEVKRLNSFTEEEWYRFRQGVQANIEHNAQRIRREHSGILHTSPWEELFK